jgi:septum formation protein
MNIDETILGKPGRHERADEMTTKLNNRTHSVDTGVFITMPKRAKSVETKVLLDNLLEAIVRACADADGPLDNAGAYGIHSGAISLIKSIDGDYSNVVGLPVNAVCREIAKLLSE